MTSPIQRLLGALCLGALLGLTAACGASDSALPDAGGTPDAGALPDAGGQPPADGGEEPPDAGLPGPAVTAQEARGAFLPNPVRAVLPGVDVVLMGTSATVLDPVWLGGAPSYDDRSQWLRAGMLALAPATGQVRVYTSGDGLPVQRYVDPFEDYGEHTISLLDLTWLEQDRVFAGAGGHRVVRGTSDGQGGWRFTSAALRAPGASVDAQVGHVALAGGELFVGTDQGVAVVDPVTLALERWAPLGVSMAGPWVYALSTATLEGQTVVAALIGPAAASESDFVEPEHVVVLRPGGETDPQLFGFGTGETPTSVLGMAGAVLVGVKQADGRGALLALRAGASGLELQVAADADALGASGYGTLLPGLMAYDARRERLLVGGTLGSGSAGGLVELAATPAGELSGVAQDVVAPGDPLRDLLPRQVDALALDAQGRIYVNGRTLCNEHKLRVSGLYRIERAEDGDVRLVRPWVSGVRDITVDPVDGHTWLALRDAAPGMQCDGAMVQQALCRLKADGSCEVFAVERNRGAPDISTAPGVASIAFGGARARELALATWHDATYARRGDGARALQTQFMPGLGLTMTRAAWGERGQLWLGSQKDWHAAPPTGPGEPPIDEEMMNHRSPGGLGLLVLDENGAPGVQRRYVRVRSDTPNVDEVAGLPSNTVWDVMPLAGEHRALVALGVERSLTVYDHLLGEPSPELVNGGVALVEDETVTTFRAPDDLLPGDVVGLARRADGSVLALDARAGLLTVDMQGHTLSPWAPARWAAPERALSLAVDASGRVAVGTTAGLYVYGTDGGVTTVSSGGRHGFVWTLEFLADGVLYAGTDSGLVRVALEGAVLPSALGPSGALPRTLWELSPWCDGSEGCACGWPGDCVEGSECGVAMGGGEGVCSAVDACAVNPGARGCACEPEASTCEPGMVCVPDSLSETGYACDPDPALCTGTSGCPCSDDTDCPSSTHYCNGVVEQCQERPACAANCTCDTPNSCPEGLVCISQGQTGPQCSQPMGLPGPL